MSSLETNLMGNYLTSAFLVAGRNDRAGHRRGLRECSFSYVVAVDRADRRVLLSLMGLVAS
jgi:hypothetical protein